MSIESASHDQLIRLAVEHANREAVERLFELHRPRLVRVVMRWIKNHEDAEDISQIVMAKAHRSLRAFKIDAVTELSCQSHCDESSVDIERQFTAWLDKIAFRSSVDFVRRSQRRHAVQVESVDDVCRYSDFPIIEQRDFRDACELFKFAKDHLNEKQYSSLYYCYVDGMSAAAIATRMNSSTLAIRALLFRARRALKSAIRKHGFEHE